MSWQWAILSCLRLSNGKLCWPAENLKTGLTHVLVCGGAQSKLVCGGAQSKHFFVKSVFHTFRVVYQLKKKGRGRKRKLVLVKTGPGGLADALSVLADDAVRP